MDNNFHNLFTKIVLVVDSLKLSNEPEHLSSTSEPELTLSYCLPWIWEWRCRNLQGESFWGGDMFPMFIASGKKFILFKIFELGILGNFWLDYP